MRNHTRQPTLRSDAPRARRRPLAALAAALVIGLLVSLGHAQDQDLDEIVWLSPRGSLEVMDDFPLWVAVDQGYFEELGLDVELQPGPLEALAVTRLVATGQADIGFPSPGVFLSSLEAGMDLVLAFEMIVGQTFNFAVAPDGPIESVQDLEGTTIALGSEGWSLIVDPMLVEAGVDPESVTYLNAGNQAARAVETGDADATLSWQGLTAQWEAQGRDYRYLLGQDFSEHPSNGYVIRAEDREDPEMVDQWTRFFRGVAMGYEFSRLNPRAAAQITYDRFPGLQDQMDPQLAMDSMLEQTDVYFGSYRLGEGYGWSNLEGWQDYIDTVHELGQIENGYDASEIVTNEFVGPANDFDQERVAQDAESFELNDAWQQVDAPEVIAEER